MKIKMKSKIEKTPSPLFVNLTIWLRRMLKWVRLVMLAVGVNIGQW